MAAKLDAEKFQEWKGRSGSACQTGCHVACVVVEGCGGDYEIEDREATLRTIEMASLLRYGCATKEYKCTL